MCAPFAEVSIELKPAPAAARRTVLFDFDGTLTRTDSFGLVLRNIILAHPLRSLAAASLLPLGLPMLFSTRAKKNGGSIFIWIASVGREGRDWIAELQTTARAAFAEDSRICQPVIDRLHAHVAAGDRVLIVTGSAASVARSICDRIGLAVPVVGSSMRRRLGGYVSRMHCFGERKLEHLARQHALTQWDIVYSDSAHDLPLMQRASQVVLVNPTARSLRKVRARLSPETQLEILRG